MRSTSMCGAALSLAAVLFVTAQGAGAADALSGDRIKSLITGNTVSGPAPGGMYDFSYMADGTTDGTLGADTDDGTWHVKSGNVFCHDWNTFLGGDEHCYQWYPAENGRYLMKNVDADRGRDLPVWKITKGTD